MCTANSSLCGASLLQVEGNSCKLGNRWNTWPPLPSPKVWHREYFKRGFDLCVFMVEVLLVSPILLERRDILGPCNSSHVNSSSSWAVTCPPTRTPSLRTDWGLYLSKMGFQLEGYPFPVFYPSGDSIYSLLIPQNRCLLSQWWTFSAVKESLLSFCVRRDNFTSTPVGRRPLCMPSWCSAHPSSGLWE